MNNECVCDYCPDIMVEILKEVGRAEELHPDWPEDLIHASAIVCEESGELVRASLNHVYSNEKLENIRKEAIHTAATAIRMLKNITPGGL